MTRILDSLQLFLGIGTMMTTDRPPMKPYIHADTYFLLSGILLMPGIFLIFLFSMSDILKFNLQMKKQEAK